MKNLHYHFNSGAKNKTRYQSGFQRYATFLFVSIWESSSKMQNNKILPSPKEAYPQPHSSYSLSQILQPAYYVAMNTTAFSH